MHHCMLRITCSTAMPAQMLARHAFSWERPTLTLFRESETLEETVSKLDTKRTPITPKVVVIGFVGGPLGGCTGETYVQNFL